MPVKSIDYIVSAKHYGGSGKAYLKKQQQALKRGGRLVKMANIDNPTGRPIDAIIHQGQWIAVCEDCGGASFIDPDEPVFFCFGCGNRSNAGNCRPVIVPDNYKDIEKVLLERPVNDIAGLTDLERVGLARPVIFIEQEEGEIVPLVRSWKPDENIHVLRAQQANAILKWKEASNGV